MDRPDNKITVFLALPVDGPRTYPRDGNSHDQDFGFILEQIREGDVYRRIGSYCHEFHNLLGKLDSVLQRHYSEIKENRIKII